MVGPEQEDLLLKLVEAERRVPRHERHPFVVSRRIFPPGVDLIHGGWQDEAAFEADIEILAQAGLLNISNASGDSTTFYVTPAGFAYYEECRRRQGQPLQRVEKQVTEFISGEWFRRRYPTAHEKWIQAEALLWSEDSSRTSSLIGHLVREAMMAFADALVTRLDVRNIPSDSAKTVARIRGVLEQKAAVGSTAEDFLKALLAYWGTVSDLAQRQEHGAQREGEDLVWEDSRRVSSPGREAMLAFAA